MALASYTLTQLSAACQHASGIATPDTGSNWTDVVNDAVQYLVGLHPWTWRQAALSLDYVASQNYVALPTDFARFHTVHLSSVTGAAIPKSLDEMIRYRYQVSGATTSNCLYYALNWVSGLPRMEVYPTPTASTVAAVVGIYIKDVPLLSAGSDKVAMPPKWHTALKYLCRGLAVSTEFEQRGPDWQMFQDMLPSLIEEDGDGQDNLGQMVGAIQETGAQLDPFAFRTVNPAP